MSSSSGIVPPGRLAIVSMTPGTHGHPYTAPNVHSDAGAAAAAPVLTVQLGHRYKGLLYSSHLANANAEQLGRGVECNFVLTRDEGPAPHLMPANRPRQVTCPDYSPTPFEGQLPRIQFKKETETNIRLGGANSPAENVDSPEVFAHLYGSRGDVAAVMTWGCLAGAVTGYTYRPEHRDLMYAGERIMDVLGPAFGGRFKSFPTNS
jgi:hypothetical protein